MLTTQLFISYSKHLAALQRYTTSVHRDFENGENSVGKVIKIIKIYNKQMPYALYRSTPVTDTISV